MHTLFINVNFSESERSLAAMWPQFPQKAPHMHLFVLVKHARIPASCWIMWPKHKKDSTFGHLVGSGEPVEFPLQTKMLRDDSFMSCPQTFAKCNEASSRMSTAPWIV